MEKKQTAVEWLEEQLNKWSDGRFLQNNTTTKPINQNNMKPKEKADELCKKMLYQIEWNAQPSTVKGVAKQCALIAVDEIINDDWYIPSFDEMIERKKYWEEVKQEIQNL